MGSKTLLAGSDVNNRLNIMTGFLSCRNSSMIHWQQRGFLNGARNSNTCSEEPGQAWSKRPKIHHASGTWKGSREISKPYPQGRGQRPRTPGTMSASDVPNWCHHWCPVPSKTLTLKIRCKRGSMSPPWQWDLVTPMPPSPYFLQLAMEHWADAKWARGTSANQQWRPL